MTGVQSPTDRQERIPWWRQDVLRAARIAVIGAGALGNEVLKNLALLGVGQIDIFDFDHVESGNLSRAVLFRGADVGLRRPKALIAAERLRELAVNPHATITGHNLDVVWDLGGGFIRRMDCVLGCLDNVEARLAIGRQCYQFGVPFIDGGIRELNGRVQLHKTGRGACFDCTIGDGERQEVDRRYSCEKVMRAQVQADIVPTVQVTSALIAGIMSQEAVNCLHGRSDRFGSVLTWLGDIAEFDRLRMQRVDKCFTCSVAPVASIHDVPLTSSDTARDLVRLLPAGWSVLLPSPFLVALRCNEGGHRSPIGKPSHRCTEDELVCPVDGNQDAISLEKIERIDAETVPTVLDRSLAELGIPDEAALYGTSDDALEIFVLTEPSRAF